MIERLSDVNWRALTRAPSTRRLVLGGRVSTSCSWTGSRTAGRTATATSTAGLSQGPRLRMTGARRTPSGRRRTRRRGGTPGFVGGRHADGRPQQTRLPAPPRGDRAVGQPGPAPARRLDGLPRVRDPELPGGRPALRDGGRPARPRAGGPRHRSARRPRRRPQPHRGVFAYDPDRYDAVDEAGQHFLDARWDGRPYRVRGWRDPVGAAPLPFPAPVDACGRTPPSGPRSCNGTAPTRAAAGSRTGTTTRSTGRATSSGTRTSTTARAAWTTTRRPPRCRH